MSASSREFLEHREKQSIKENNTKTESEWNMLNLKKKSKQLSIKKKD